MNTIITFSYAGISTRVLFGVKSVDHVKPEVEQLGARRVMVVCGPLGLEVGKSIAAALGDLCVAVCNKATMHVPVEVVRAVLGDVSAASVDCLVAVGGGSAIGLAKAIALEASLPILAIPTTYAGSEMTPVYGVTEGAQKRTGRDARVRPKIVIYDPSLTLSLPKSFTVTSAINAIAHAVEGLYAPDANPISDLFAEEGIRALSAGLPNVIEDPNNPEARSDCLYGAWLCGAVLGMVGMGLHHKVCHALGGSFNLPHSETHTVILPHAVAYNLPAAPQLQRVAKVLGSRDPAVGLYRLAQASGAAVSLEAIGMREQDLDRAAKIICETPYPNPRPADLGAIRAMLANAFYGREPTASS